MARARPTTAIHCLHGADPPYGVQSQPPVPSFRSDLEPFLREFADQHKGVRPGVMFGRPAIYVGRKLIACLMDDGVIVRLPDEVARRELRGSAKPFSQRGGRPLGAWVSYTPKTSMEARRLTPILETAVTHIARRQVEEMTGVTLRRPLRRAAPLASRVSRSRRSKTR
jgi:hypothetical protein